MSSNILCSTSVVNMKFAKVPLQVCFPPPPCLGRSHKLQGEFGAYMEETVRRVTPRSSARAWNFSKLQRQSSKFFQVPEPIWAVRNPIYRNISSYSFIFSTYSFIFPTYSFMFFTYSFMKKKSIFYILFLQVFRISLHISLIFLHVFM